MLLQHPPVTPPGSPSPCRASPTCRSEVRLWPHVGHKRGWLLGASWEEAPSWLSLPHPEGPGGFPPNLKEPGLLGSPRLGGEVCHGHIPKASDVPKANCVPQCQLCPQGQPYPQGCAQSHPKATHVPMANHISKAKCVPSANCVPRANHVPKPATSSVPTTSPTASPRPTTSLRPTVSLKLVMSPGPLRPMVQGFPAQPVPFGPLHLSVAGRATPGTGSPPCPAHIP